jgi:membrane-associated phospholipid phosphatase
MLINNFNHLMGKYPILKLLYIVSIFIQMMSISFGQQYAKSIPDSSSIIVKLRPDSAENIERQVTWHQMFTNIPSDYIGLFHNSSGSKYILSLLSVGALTGTLLFFDNGGWNFNHSLMKKSPFVHKISDLSIKMGDGRNQFISAALFAIPGIILNDKTAIRTGSNIVESIISTGIFVQILKRITGRESPAASTEHGGDWDPFPSIKQYQKNQPSFYSFPSGHLATATAVITVIANNYPDQKWIRPVGYPLLGLLGFSLVSEGMHWYSDLPLAVLLGYTFGNIIAPERIIPSQDNEKSALSIVPSITLNGIQLGILYKL